MTSADDVAKATQADPEGAICGFCQLPNDNADDCGWWYLSPFGGGPYDLEQGPKGPSRAACQACDRGVPGQLHRDRYGVGER